MPFKISMNLVNPNVQFRQNMNAYAAAPVLQIPRPVALNASMIDRIHKAKPGCSACGKKVA
jgi:hypothetical protein